MLLKRTHIKNHNIRIVSMAIGNFDGIHLGHRFIIDELKKLKINKNDNIAILTFTPHPVKLLKPEIWKKNLIKFRTKFRILKNLGVDLLYQIPFSLSFSQKSARFFIEKVLIEDIKAENILVGEDFRFGNKRAGNVKLLQEYSDKNKFKLRYFKKKGTKESYYSSSSIRNHIISGDLIKAKKSLGYYWEVEGKVISGRAKGRELGYPTANINYLYQIPPANGIYAGWVKIEGESKWREAAISSGVRPHYNGVKKILEVHLLFFSGNLYEKRLRVAFIEKIRDEKKFENEKDLVREMKKDCEYIKNILKKKYIENDNVGHNGRL